VARFFARKLIQSAVVLVAVTLLVQVLTDLMPGSAADTIVGDTNNKEAIAAINAEYGLDDPFWSRYWDFVTNALQGDLGRSIQSRETVTSTLMKNLPVTVEIAVLALLLALLIAIPVAMYCAAREGSVVDRVATGLASTLIAIPSFVTCVILTTVLAIQAGLFPSYGWVPISTDVGQHFQHAALPILVLALSCSPIFLRVLRADLVSTLREDFVLAARAKGLPDTYIMMRHALRPASLSLFTLTGLIFGFLLGGSIIIETYFSLPGIGQVVSQSVGTKDLPIVQGVVVLVALVFLVINTLVDFGYRFLNPQAGMDS
jgi:peptide/nickel transport system permease protein